MEHFAQTNVFGWIWTVFAHLIIGCAIRYPKIGNLRYSMYNIPKNGMHGVRRKNIPKKYVIHTFVLTVCTSYITWPALMDERLINTSP